MTAMKFAGLRSPAASASPGLNETRFFQDTVNPRYKDSIYSQRCSHYNEFDINNS